MPFISLNTPDGKASISYTISTPSETSSESIDSKFPTILFLHGEWISQEAFEPQFSDPLLRNHFNLLAIELRTCGQSSGPVKKGKFTFATAADDIHRVLNALDVSHVHLFALSIGCHVAIEFAHAYPTSTLSLTLCGMLPPDEPEDVAAGRMQVWNYWTEAFNHDVDEKELLEEVDSLSELLNGALMLLFSGQQNALVQPLANVFTVNVIKNWAGNPDKLEAAYEMCIEWLLRRKHFDVQFLSKISCPVDLIRCKDDIAYGDPGAFRDFKAMLEQAGLVDVVLHEVDGPHIASVLIPEDINDIIFKRAASISSIDASAIDGTEVQFLLTPFTGTLVQYGYDADPTLGDVGVPALESSYPMSPFGIKTLVEDHFSSESS